MKRNHLAHWLLLLVIASLTLGCAGRALKAPEERLTSSSYGLEASARQDVAVEPEWEGPVTAGSGMPTSAELERKIIYNVAMHLIVKDTD